MTSPTTPAHNSLIRIADLLNRPGASRRLDVSLDTPEGLVLDMATVAGPIRLQGVIESVVDGLLVRATLSAPLNLSCARCLKPLETTVSTDVTELFSDPARADDPADVDEGYEIRETEIDLDTLVRDALVPAVPYRPLCDEACAGLCPTCGVDLNEADCDCVEDTADPRWAALEGLRLPDADSNCVLWLMSIREV